MPLTLLVLAVLAVPLARTEPRKGRFAGLASAVLVYLIYANLLAAGRGWIERGQVPEAAGLWWVHGLFLAAAGVMLVYQLGLWRQWVRASGGRPATPGRGDPVRILRGYLFRTILGTTGLVLAVLLSLGAFIEFVGQLDDIGVGEYGLLDALGWVLLQMPTIVAQLLPIAALLGALLGLGSLASRSELIVLRAAGVSPRGLARSVLVTGIVLAAGGHGAQPLPGPAPRALRPPAAGAGQVRAGGNQRRRQRLDSRPDAPFST